MFAAQAGLARRLARQDRDWLDAEMSRIRRERFPTASPHDQLHFNEPLVAVDQVHWPAIVTAPFWQPPRRFILRPCCSPPRPWLDKSQSYTPRRPMRSWPSLELDAGFRVERNCRNVDLKPPGASRAGGVPIRRCNSVPDLVYGASSCSSRASGKCRTLD